MRFYGLNKGRINVLNFYSFNMIFQRIATIIGNKLVIEQDEMLQSQF